MDGVHILDGNVPDIAPELHDAEGRLRVMPAAFYASKTPETVAVYCVRNGSYGLPTTELCEWLTGFIGGRSALEIGAGNGGMAAHLKIRAVDNYMQDTPALRLLYRAAQQAPVKYGSNVEKMEANDAVKLYKPQVVIGYYITHRYNAAEHWRGGNMYAPDIPAILQQVEHYIHIGNEKTHARDPLLALPHETYYFPWLYSRSSMWGRDFIGVWKGTG